MPGGVRALAFDVFGTVVDWRGSIMAEGEALGTLRGITADWGAVQTGGGRATSRS